MRSLRPVFKRNLVSRELVKEELRSQFSTIGNSARNLVDPMSQESSSLIDYIKKQKEALKWQKLGPI
jgi:hypothetical protein